MQAGTPCCTAVEFALLAPSPAVPGRCAFRSFQRLEPATAGPARSLLDGRLASQAQRILCLDLAALALTAWVSVVSWELGKKKTLVKSIHSMARNKSFGLSW